MIKKLNVFLSVILVMALGLCLPVFADDGGTNDPIIAEIARNNSLYVTVSSETARTFTPADFPEVVANRVVCVKKSALQDGGYNYTLVLVLGKADNLTDEDVKAALEKVKTNSLVKKADINEEYYQFGMEGFIGFNTRAAIKRPVKLGQRFTEIIQLEVSAEFFKAGTFFCIDSQKFDTETITKDSFKDLGVEHFWPMIRANEDRYFKLEDLAPVANEGKKSENGWYFAPNTSLDSVYETVNNLAGAEYVTSAYVGDLFDGGDGTYETKEEYKWEISPNEGVIEWKTGETLGVPMQYANARFSKPGVYTITFKFVPSGAQTPKGYGVSKDNFLLSFDLDVTVLDEYMTGDINKDLNVTAADALLALQSTVEKVTLTDEEKALADMNNDSKVTSDDALLILQKVVGKLGNTIKWPEGLY